MRFNDWCRYVREESDRMMGHTIEARLTSNQLNEIQHLKWNLLST